MALYGLDFGEEHPDVARCASKLGRVKLDQGDQGGAEECCERAVGIYERIGGDPSELAVALEDYAATLRKAGREAEAEKAEARARLLRAPARSSEAPKP